MVKTVYVAGKWSTKDVIKQRMNELEAMGFKVTHDWTTYESDKNNSRQDMADKDIQGVTTADMYVGILDDPSYPYRGSFTELGAALATQRLRPEYRIYVICPFHKNPPSTRNCTTNCFFHASGITHLTSWDELLNELKTSQ